MEIEHPKDEHKETMSGEESPDHTGREISNTGNESDTTQIKNEKSSEDQTYQRRGSNPLPRNWLWISSQNKWHYVLSS